MQRFIVGCQGKMYRPQEGYCFHDALPWSADVVEAEYPVGYLQGAEVRLQILMPGQVDGLNPAELRRLLSVASCEQEYVVLSRAAQLITWHNEHRFCGRCGAPMQHHVQDLAKHCTACELVQYPRISPCVIVLVVDGDRCLLARSPHFPPGRFSTLAGFIEAGETAEHAVAREIREEVGIEVKNIRYLKSQSWPFPHSLMLGFVADYAGGELNPDGVEIEEAHWYSRETMPDLPPSFAISYSLIQGFLDGDY